MEERLFRAVQLNDIPQVRTLLRDPTVDVNWKNGSLSNWTCLHISCEYQHLALIHMLLEHPRIDVNPQDEEGDSPFYRSCVWGRANVVNLLLQDPRLDCNLADHYGNTPLSWACYWGHVDVVELLLASGRKLDVLKRNPLERARSQNFMEVVDLLESYGRDVEGTTGKVRKLLSWNEDRAGETFALVVYLCDDYLRVRPSPFTASSKKALRFFSIACQLPLDLQMLLCNRTFDLQGTFVRKAHSEKGFRKLARIFEL